MLTHQNLIANMMQAKWIVEPLLGNSANMIGLVPLPLYHVLALSMNCLLFIELGLTGLLITNPRDIPGFIKELKKYKVSVITGVNTLFNALLNHESFKEVDFHT